jgi:2Fe-2S ferredoxin
MKVTFLPIGKTFEAKPGESVLDVAIRNDISMMHACGGFCSCTTCHVRVESGFDNLTKPDDDEIERMEYLDERGATSRLGCQAKVKGDLSVTVVNED